MKKMAAVFAVAITLVSIFAVVSFDDGEVRATGGDHSQSVTYHSGVEGNADVTISYDGIASAEYNPMYWSSDNGKTNWSGPMTTVPQTVTFEVDVDYTSDKTKQDLAIDLPEGVASIVSVTVSDRYLSIRDCTLSVVDYDTEQVRLESDPYGGLFANYNDGTVTIEVKFEVGAVFGGWSINEGSTDVDYLPGDILNGVSDLYAVWIMPTTYMDGNSNSYDMGSSHLRITDVPFTEWDFSRDHDSSIINQFRTLYTSDSAYGNIYVVNSNVTVDNPLPMGTYRGATGNEIMTLRGSFVLGTDHYSSRVAIDGDVIFENISLKQYDGADYSHGDSNRGLYANGHRLILGVGVNTVGGDRMLDYLQVYGGTSGDGLTAADGEYATNLVIFSGTYSNVIAGSFSAVINGDTHLVIRGGTVLDTIQGGNSSRNDEREDSSATGGNRIMGDTHVYILGDTWMPGDYYEEVQMGTQWPDGIPRITESTILTGGSNDGYIDGDTNVYVSNDAELWDVQAGGRRGNSTVNGTANAEISGSALIKHVLCGSITDGMAVGGSNPHNDKSCVGGTNLRVTDSARVGSVFGAGYDTYYSADYASMVGGTISVTIDGESIVGYVYGGGYRGTIGNTDHSIESITITIGADSRVLHDVFGGGRGGLDKILHDNGGTNNGGSMSDDEHVTSMNDSTGHSKVYANSIRINVLGKVGGSVYGGGESVPVITSYNGVQLGTSGKDAAVAAVYCGSVEVTVGGSVAGDVYGAGKGADAQDVVNGIHSSAFIFAMGSDGVMNKIPWVSGSGGTAVSTGDDYSDYALLDGGSSVTVNGTVAGDVYGGGENGNLAGGAEVSIGTGSKVSGSVYGGGNIGTVAGDTAVTVSGSVDGSVYGSGKGLSGDTAAGSVKSTSVIIDGTVGADVYGGGELGGVTDGATVRISSGSTVSGSVYGGGEGSTDYPEQAKVGGDISVTVSGTVMGDVYGGGSLASVGGNITLELNGADVSGGVYGGGKGVSKAESTSYETIANVPGNVTVRVTNKSEVGGNLFGGGMYGALTRGQDTVLKILIEDSAVTGSVYSGGMGEANRLAVDVLDRRLEIAGSSIGGSVYGGSMLGDDNCTSTAGGISSSKTGDRTSTIVILSGNIRDGTSGNVYGAGYRGYSAMDTHVYIGSEASGRAQLTQASAGTVQVHSVYGGSSVGFSDSELAGAKLLRGDTEVNIGSGVSVDGDVFGSGDHCDNDGSSHVTFRGFEQGGSMLSVQKADDLDIIDSVLVLDGSASSSSSDLNMVSMNLIGHLDLMSEKTQTSVDLHQSATQITNYSSTYDGSYSADSPAKYNILRMHNGMMFTIMGPDGHTGACDVTGKTLFVSDANDYYGALVMAADPDSTAEFYVLHEGSYQEAQEIQRRHGGVDVSIWYISGFYKVTQTAVIEDDGTPGMDFSVTIPQLVDGSEIHYTGFYVNPVYPEGMQVVSDASVAGTEFELLLYDSNLAGGYVNLATAGDVKLGDSVTDIKLSLSTLPGYTVSGHIGTITIHLAEMKDDVPVNSMDVEIDVYLRVSTANDSIEIAQDITMVAGNGIATGTADIYLPVLDENATAVYTIESVSGLDGKISILTVPTGLNKSGWVHANHRDTALTISDDGACSHELGSGGVLSPVLRVTYTSSSLEDVTLTISMVEENGTVTKIIKAVINPEKESDVTVTFTDSYVDAEGKWQTINIFELTVRYNAALSSQYVLAVKDSSQWDAAITLDYLGNVSSLLKQENGVIITAADRGALASQAGDDYNVLSVQEFLNKVVANKPDSTYKVGEISDDVAYPDAVWNTKDGSLYNFGSKVSKDISLVSGYDMTFTVTVTYPVSEDGEYPGTTVTVKDAWDKELTGTPVWSGNVLTVTYEAIGQSYTISVSAEGFAVSEPKDIYELDADRGIAIEMEVLYTITFENWDNTVLYSQELVYGATPDYTGDTPTKAGDAQYSYTFTGWNPGITTVTGNQTYKAKFEQTVNEYTITFKNGDATLQTDKVAYGQMPEYTGDIPTKEADDRYTYTFSGWSPDLAKVTGNLTYTAVFSTNDVLYTITFVNWDNTVLDSQELVYGATPDYTGDEPTRAGDAQYSYTFTGWDPEISTVTGNQTYKAEFEQAVNKYTITFVNYGGALLQTQQVAYGDTPVYTGQDPVRASTVEYTYEFAGWTPAIGEVTGEQTYTARYIQSAVFYLVRFVDWDGTELQRDSLVYGATPSYRGDTPVRDADDSFTYTFAGWTPAFSAVTGDATYTATYTGTPVVRLVSITLGGDFRTGYIVGEGLDLTGLTVTAHYSDGTEEDVPLAECGVSPMAGTPLSVSDTLVTVTYGGCEASYPIHVRELMRMTVFLTDGDGVEICRHIWTEGDSTTLGQIVEENSVTGYIAWSYTGGMVTDAGSFAIEESMFTDGALFFHGVPGVSAPGGSFVPDLCASVVIGASQLGSGYAVDINGLFGSDFTVTSAGTAASGVDATVGADGVVLSSEAPGSGAFVVIMETAENTLVLTVYVVGAFWDTI